MENLLKKIEELRERFIKIKSFVDLEALATESREKKFLMNEPDFWQDRDRAKDISRRAEELDSEVSRWEKLEAEIRSLEEIAALADKEGEESLHDEVMKKAEELSKILDEREFLLLFSGKYDRQSAIISVHAGVGGVDAQDWAEILERMFLRFAEKEGYKTEMIDRNVGQEAGIKSSSFRVMGPNAYGYFKSENGVHRLVRISPFDAESMRHTSFALVEVIPEIDEVENLELKEEDLKWEFYRSSGPGGQNVNKTSSAVRLVHLPTNIVVSCQSERSQHQNREIALKILQAKLKLLEEERKDKEEAKLKGNVKQAEWGKQIRSYVMQPYQLVKDHRSDYETSDIKGVLDGELKPFMAAYLSYLRKKKK